MVVHMTGLALLASETYILLRGGRPARLHHVWYGFRPSLCNTIHLTRQKTLHHFGSTD